MMRRI